jgi:predicted dithiol-disulfide oxidoreductase (DUF899 family)
MTEPKIVSAEEWLAARKTLRHKENQAAQTLESLSAERRRLPMVKVEKRYTFEGPKGETDLLELFDGRRQLITYHFMFDPEWGEGCKHCSFLVDNIGHLSHLHARDTTLVLISRAPLAKLEAFKGRMGWSIPWFSSFGSDFNYDFHVTLDESIAPVMYDFRDKATLEANGEFWFTKGEQGGVSVFLRAARGADDRAGKEADETIFHTYSAYGDGNDLLHGTYNYLDLTPLGRQETEPGRPWLRHHDRYPEAS